MRAGKESMLTRAATKRVEALYERVSEQQQGTSYIQVRRGILEALQGEATIFITDARRVNDERRIKGRSSATGLSPVTMEVRSYSRFAPETVWLHRNQEGKPFLSISRHRSRTSGHRPNSLEALRWIREVSKINRVLDKKTPATTK